MCHAYCISDNFPDNLCHEVEYNIEYNGNKYKHFFEYHDPYTTYKHVTMIGLFKLEI